MRARWTLTPLMLATIVSTAQSSEVATNLELIASPTARIHPKAPVLLGSNRQGGARGASAMEPRRQARLYQGVLVAWLYNFGVAVSALQQQYIFHQLFSEDGSAVPTPMSALLYGYKKACDYLFTFLTVGWCGALSDRVGRRPLMAYSAAGLAVGFLMVGTCNRRLPQQLLLAGCIDGLSSCMPNICQAYVSDLSPDEGSRAKNLALLQGASLTGAFLVGFPLSVFISSRTNSYRIPVFVAAVSQLLNILVILLIPESKLPSAPVKVARKRSRLCRVLKRKTGHEMPQTKKKVQLDPPWAALLTLATPTLQTLAVAYVLAIIVQSSLDDGFLLSTQLQFGWGQQQAAPILVLVGILLAAVPQFLIPRLGVQGSISFGLPVLAAGMAGLCLAPTPALFIAAICVVSVGCVCLPTMLVYLISLVPEDQKGAALGAVEALKTLAKVLSSSTTPAAFALFTSNRAPFGIRLPGAPFGWASIVAIASFMVQMRAMGNLA